jgi:hypothetical protein
MGKCLSCLSRPVGARPPRRLAQGTVERGQGPLVGVGRAGQHRVRHAGPEEVEQAFVTELAAQVGPSRLEVPASFVGDQAQQGDGRVVEATALRRAGRASFN